MAVEQKVQLHRGLRNIYIDKTQTAFIDGKEGKLLYRGYNIHDLAEHSNFEETAYLLLHGSLPTSRQFSQFDAQLKANRELPDEILELIKLNKHGHPMDVLRTAVSAMSSHDPVSTDISPEAVLTKGIKLTAVLPTIVASHARIREGKEAVLPNGELTHSGNFLYMLFDRLPDSDETMLVDKDFLLHAEHGVNASTFAARVAASTKADYYAAITAGLSVLKGPLHGGAAEGVAKMAKEIGTEENTAPYINDLLDRRERVMGIGHAVYKAVDPRSVHLMEGARMLGERKGQPEWFSILQAVTEVMKPYTKKGLYPNVDFWAGAIYHLLEIPEDIFIPIFAIGRVPGWTLHVMEQYANNVLLRPKLAYTGPMDLEYIPINERG